MPIFSCRIAALTLAAVALAGLTACTGLPAGPDSTEGGEGSQTTVEACAIVQDAISDATAEFEDVEPADQGALVDAMQAAAQSLGEVSSQISDEDVAAIVPSLQEMFEQVADATAAVVAGDASALADLEGTAADFRETTERFQELCAPAG